MPRNEQDRGEKKQLLLRLSPTLWAEISDWAEDDFRSVNGQIEYLLSECVRARKKGRIKRAAVDIDVTAGEDKPGEGK
ncbi:MAG: PTS ascorbate transporter subunit IIC [Eubacteriales bacterium]